MVATDRVQEIFDDVRAMHEAALDRLEAGDIRDSAEKAWCATRRATDALILAWTNREPERVPETTRELRKLGNDNELGNDNAGVALLVNRYCAVRDLLHGDCFYFGLCDPIEDTERRIRQTLEYIDDAVRLADLARNG
jgi:hypothetical protein